MSKNKKNNKKVSPKAKLQSRRLGETLLEYYQRQLKAREAELREIEENKKQTPETEKTDADKKLDEIDVDRPHVNAIVFAQLGICKELAKSLRKHGGKPKNIPEATKKQADEYAAYLEETLTDAEKEYIEALRKGSKDLNTALDACDMVVGYYKIERARDSITKDISMDILAKADEMFENLSAIAHEDSLIFLISTPEISMDFHMGYNNESLRKDITTMIAYAYQQGGNAVIARFDPAYKEQKETRYFSALEFKDGDVRECTEEENKAYFADFMDNKIPEDMVCVFTTMTAMMEDYGLSVSMDD